MICRPTEASVKGGRMQWECVDEDHACGRIELFPCAVYIEGERVECAWLGIDAENAQAGKMLLHTAVNHAEEKEIPLCMCLGNDTELFAHECFSARERQIAAFSIDPAWMDGRFSMRPAEEKDGAWLRGLYSLYAGTFDAAFVRGSEEYWKEQVIPNLNNLSVLEKEGQIVAYIAYEKGEDHLFVQEFAAHPDYDVLLCAVAMAAQGKKKAVVPMPILEGNGKKIGPETVFDAAEKLFFRVNRPFLFKNSRIRADLIPQNFMSKVLCWAADSSR